MNISPLLYLVPRACGARRGRTRAGSRRRPAREDLFFPPVRVGGKFIYQPSPYFCLK